MQPIHRTTHGKEVSGLYDRIARVMLYLIALTPLVYLPWTIEGLEVNKQTWLLMLMSVATLAWLGHMVAKRSFFLKRSWMYVGTIGIVLSTALAAFFSLAPFTSWIGGSMQEYTSFLTIFFCGMLFLVGSHYLSALSAQRTLWSVALITSACVGAHAMLGAVGWNFFATNFIGTPNALGLYLAAMSVLGLGLWLVAPHHKGEDGTLPEGTLGAVVRVSIVLTFVATVVYALAIDYWGLWVALLVGLLGMFTFAMMRANVFLRVQRFVLPMVLLVLSLLFLFMPSFISGLVPSEISPSWNTSMDTMVATWSEYSWFTGSGPGTYIVDYGQFRPREINDTAFWDTRFDRSGSHLLTWGATTGVIGLVLLAGFIITLLLMALNHLIREQAHDAWKLSYAAWSAWMVLVVGMVTYSSNMTLTVLFWLLSAVLFSQIRPTVKEIDFKQAPRFALATTFGFVLVSVGVVTLMLAGMSRYAAEIAFAKAIQADRSGADIQEVVTMLDQAARLNKQNDVYYRQLAHGLLLMGDEMAADTSTDPNDLRVIVGSAINAAKRATELSPYQVTNWSLLGDIYREVSPVVSGASEASIAAFERTLELDPNNPKYPTALAQAYLVYADELSVLTKSEDETLATEAASLRAEVLQEAEDALNLAIDLKPDYGPAHYYLVLTYTQQGNVSQAIARMETLVAAEPGDTGLALQLGILYLQQGKYEQAQSILEAVVAYEPQFSNARWYLSSVYEQLGDIEAAIEQVEMVASLNPGDALITQRLERLQAGVAVEEIPEPLEDDGAVEENLGDLGSESEADLETDE